MNYGIICMDIEGVKSFINELYEEWGDLSNYGFDAMPNESIDSINDPNVLVRLLDEYLQLGREIAVELNINDDQKSELN
jgi:hypothetical protein